MYDKTNADGYNIHFQWEGFQGGGALIHAYVYNIYYYIASGRAETIVLWCLLCHQPPSIININNTHLSW